MSFPEISLRIYSQASISEVIVSLHTPPKVRIPSLEDWQKNVDRIEVQKKDSIIKGTVVVRKQPQEGAVGSPQTVFSSVFKDVAPESRQQVIPQAESKEGPISANRTSRRLNLHKAES
jgi:hypothetical protein